MPLVPYKIKSKAFLLSSFTGLLKSISYSSLNALNIENVHESSLSLPSPQVAIAPSNILKSLLGITKFSSISIRVPNPSQLSHLPNGELKENNLGASSSILIPH